MAGAFIHGIQRSSSGADADQGGEKMNGSAAVAAEPVACAEINSIWRAVVPD